MSNSALVNYIKISPHRTSPRTDVIRKITIHHMAGNLSVETCGNVFQTNEASSNYGIGTDGRVGMYCEEKDRAWACFNGRNDNQSINIEVANDEIGGNWHVSDVAFAKLIDLCVDICKRNNIDKLIWTGNADGNLTCHYMFMPTACPGEYLKSRMPEIAKLVNERLHPEPVPEKRTFHVGDTIKLKQDAVYYNGDPIPNWVKNTTLYLRELVGDRAVVSTQKSGAVTGAVNVASIVGYNAEPEQTFHVGDVVKLKPNAVYYDGVNIPNWVKNTTLYLRELVGNRAVISTQKTGAITGAVHKDYLTK